MMLGKRVFSPQFNIHALSDMPTYKGVKLLGNTTMDAYGQIPAKDLTIVEKGLVKNFINDDKPALGAMTPTGKTFKVNSYATDSGFGILHITYEKTVPYSKMRKQLANEARKAGLDYAYIVKSMGNDFTYLVRYDINTGEEEIVDMNGEGLSALSRKDMNHLTAVSNEESVLNKYTYVNFYQMNRKRVPWGGRPTSIIAPEAFIVENREINFMQPRCGEDFNLKNPALR